MKLNKLTLLISMTILSSATAVSAADTLTLRYDSNQKVANSWVEHTPELANCVNLGVENNTTAWQPALNKQESDFIQTRTYESEQQCDVQPIEVNTKTDEVRLIGTPTNEQVTIVYTESRDIAVSVTDWSESDVMDENNEWTPAIGEQTQPFKQTKAISGTTHQERTFTYTDRETGTILYSETETELADPDLDTRTIIPFYTYVGADQSSIKASVNDVTSLFGNYFDLQGSYASCIADLANCDYVRHTLSQRDIVASKLQQHHGNLENTILYGGITTAQLLDAKSMLEKGMSYLDSIEIPNGLSHANNKLGAYTTSYSYSLFERLNTEMLLAFLPLYEDALNINSSASANVGYRFIENNLTSTQQAPINLYFANLTAEEQGEVAASFTVRDVRDAHLFISHAYGATSTQAISASGTPCKHTGWDSDTEIPVESRCTEDYKLQVTFEPVGYTITTPNRTSNFYQRTPDAQRTTNSVTLETGFYSLGSPINQIWSRADFEQAISDGTINL